MSEGKASNKALFDVVFNSDFEKIDFDKLNEIKNDEKDNNLNKEKEKNDEKKINTKETKYDKSGSFSKHKSSSILILFLIIIFYFLFFFQFNNFLFRKIS